MVDEKLEWKKLFNEINMAYAKYKDAEKEIIQKAYEFANEKHKTQKRDGGEPYIIHLIRVARLAFENKRSTNFSTLLCAALLHDTLEDTYTSYRELEETFGEAIASLVMEVTSASLACRIEGKDNYLSHKMQYMTSYALYIKLADRLDNICDLDHTSAEKKERMLRETRNIISYLSKNVHFTKSQQKLVDKIEKILNKKTA